MDLSIFHLLFCALAPINFATKQIQFFDLKYSKPQDGLRRVKIDLNHRLLLTKFRILRHEFKWSIFKYQEIDTVYNRIQHEQKIKVWLDCDPGHDDMLAIIMAAMTDQIDLFGVSTSAGNSVIQNTTQNALDILYEIGRSDIEVVRGAQGPLCRNLKTAPEIHGKTGLEGTELLKSPNSAVTRKPFLHIYNRIMAELEPIEFVVTGAMTNLALLIRAFPDIKEKIRGITFMGGAIGLGNMNPAAEFNMLVDPQAAQIVFASGLPMTMVPLQVTHTTIICENIFDQLKELKSDFGKKLEPQFRYFQKRYKQLEDFDYPVAHDPCTIFYLLHPELFEARKAYVEVQVEGRSRGRTNCHFLHRQPNVNVCTKMNVCKFWEKMMECLKKIQ